MRKVETGKEHLEHYGVLGMKWGVRKQDNGSKVRTGSSADSTTGYEPKNSTYNKGTIPSTKNAKKPNPQQRKNIAKKVAIGAAVVAALGIAVYSGAQVSNYKATKDHISKTLDIRGVRKQYGKDFSEKFQKGHEFLRASDHEEVNIRDRAFAVSKGKDFYKSWADYKISISATKDIKSASNKDKIDTIAESLTKPDIKKMAGKRAPLGDKLAYLRADKKDIASMKLGDIAGDWWRGEDAEKLIDDLLSKGFSATKDEADGKYTSAHILFDKEAFKFNSAEKINR